MAITQNTFNGNGSNLGPFSFTFKWLESTDIKVTVGGVLKTAGTHYNLQGLNYTTKTGGQVLFTAGNAPPVGTNNIRIYRDTDDTELSATFSSGSAIRAKDLNDNFTQNLYVTQEVRERYLDRQSGEMESTYVPTTSTSLITKGYMETNYGIIDEVGFTRWRQTATASQTTFSGPGNYGGVLSYVPTKEQVYLNGALQQRDADYTANNGSSITFNVALTVGDIVDVVCVNNLTASTVSNASNISYSGQFTGQSTRTVAAKLADVVSVKDFGAVGDGVTDDTAAIQAAIQAVNGLTKKPRIFFPAGQYRLLGSVSSNKAIALIGEGKEQTQLIWPAAATNYGITITYDSSLDKAHPYVGYMSFVRDSAYGGTALTINGSTAGVGHPDSQRVIIENVRFDRGQRNEGTGSWQYGMLLYEVSGADVVQCDFQGDVAQSPTAGNGRYYGTFAKVQGVDATPEVAEHINFDHIRVRRAFKGIEASSVEGVDVGSFHFLNVDYGITWDNSGRSNPATVAPRISIHDGHIQFILDGIKFLKAQASSITSVYLLNIKEESDATGGTATPRHVVLDGCLNTNVHNNMIEGAGTAASTANGVVLLNSSYDNIIASNTFFSSGSTAVSLDATSESNYIDKNYFRSSQWTSYIVNNASFNMVYDGFCTVRNTANISIPNNSTTEITFDDVWANELGTGWVNLGTNPTRITVKKAGKYRLVASAEMAANATGARRLDIRVNGGLAIGTNGIAMQAGINGPALLNCSTPLIRLNANDYVTATITQTSGGPLDLAANATLTLEFVDVKK